jgi:Sulfate permease family
VTASIAGLPAQAGLYVALVPMFVYALLGTSRPLEREQHQHPRDPDGNRIDDRCA